MMLDNKGVSTFVHEISNPFSQFSITLNTVLAAMLIEVWTKFFEVEIICETFFETEKKKTFSWADFKKLKKKTFPCK